jgi:hypothetical protein
MAGYNANKMTAKTFDDRITMAKNKMTPGEYKDKRIAALEGAKQNFLDAEDESEEIYDFKKKEKQLNKKNNVINRFLTDRKQKKEDARVAKEKQAAEIERAKRGQAPSDPGSRGRDDTPGFGKTTAGNYTNQFQGGDPGLMAKGGRVGYFFGGRVNYKAGGRTDAGPNRTTASHSTRGQINESGQQVSGGQTTRDNNNDGGNSPFYGPKPTFFNNPEILNKETILGDIPTGIGFDNSYGRYKATMDLEESLKEKGLEGEIEYNNNIGNFDLAAKYNTQDGPSYGAGYTGNNFDVGVNNKTGASANYSKDIFDGRGKITAGGTYNPDGTYNAEGKISFNYANGGLASIL